jgi:hypothetical protein
MIPAEEIALLTVERLFGEPNIVIKRAAQFVDSATEITIEDREIVATTQLMPRKLAYVYCIRMLEGLFCNGGMQHVILGGRGTAWSDALLTISAEAYRYFESEEKGAVVSELRSKASRWITDCDSLSQQEADDSAFKVIWDEIDEYDFRFERAGETKYEDIVADIKLRPADYLA